MTRQIEAGYYEQKQLASPSKVVAWSHSSRFEVAKALLTPLAGGRLLDYGSGDGTLLKQVADSFPDAVGADPTEEHVIDSRKRFAGVASLSFYTIDELLDRFPPGSFDVITCMEVLEHCVAAEVERVLDNLASLVKPSGTVIISVPIEIGPSLFLKQTARRLAGMRGVGEYAFTERYTTLELLKMTFATSSTGIDRPTHVAANVGASHGHKGFNWRALQKRIELRFRVRQRRFSPLGFLGGFVSSQTWFVCSPLPRGSAYRTR